MKESAILKGVVALAVAIGLLGVGIASTHLDIKPGRFPNTINPKSNGVVPVAFIPDTATPCFDVSTINVASVKFGPLGGPFVATPVYGGHIEDVDGHGCPDLVLHYRQKEIGLTSSDTFACLLGDFFLAPGPCDSVRVLNK